MTQRDATKRRGRLRRARVIAADKAYPGGLAAHLNPADPPPPPPPPPPPLPGARIDRLADRPLRSEEYVAPGPVQTELSALITDEELAALQPLLTEEERAFLAAHGPESARVWSVGLALHHGVGEVARRTGLATAMPPESVHSMMHATWVTGGDPRYADFVLAAFAEAGTPLEPGMSVLDFGCSSARVVRMLAVRRPGLDWHGCDVNADAIAWARDALPAVTFHDQPLRPPLTALADDSLDAVFAISIWSHFDQAPALAWLAEMERVIRPGGALLITTHGYGAVAKRASHHLHGEAGQEPLLEPLYRDGFAFVAFGDPDGDGGVVDDQWGTSFLTPEWLAAQVTPRWSVRLYRPRAVEDHQDLYVLRREADA